MRYLTNLLFFDIPLLYCYTNLNSPIICCLSSGDIYFFRYIFWTGFVYILGAGCACFCFDISIRLFLNTRYFISSFVTNQITSCFCCFSNCFFGSSFYCIRCRFFSTIENIGHIFCLNF